MHARRTAFVLVSWVALVALVSAGCASTGSGSLFSDLTSSSSKEDNSKYPNPAARIAQCQEMGKMVDRLKPEDQQLMAENLARMLHTEQDALVRAELVRTLARCPSLVATESLRHAMRDPVLEVRVATCEAWGVHGGPSAVPALTSMLTADPELDVRLAAIRSLGKLKDPAAVESLARALEDPNPALQYRAVEALRLVSGKEYGDDVNAWRAYCRGENPPEISLTERVRRLF